jgi:hypothetical protein
MFKFKPCCDLRSIGQSVLLSGPHLEPMTRFLLLLDICGLHVVGRPTRRKDGSVIYWYNVQSLSGRSSSELMTTSLLSSLFMASYDSQG